MPWGQDAPIDGGGWGQDPPANDTSIVGAVLSAPGKIARNFASDYHDRITQAANDLAGDFSSKPLATKSPLRAGLIGLGEGAKGLMDAANYAAAPFNAAADTILGRPVEAATGGLIPRQTAANVGMLALPVAGEIGAARAATAGARAAGVGRTAYEAMAAQREAATASLRPSVAARRALIPAPAPSRAQSLMNEGVSLTPGQRIGGPALALEDKAMSVPILGDAIRGARVRGRLSLNRVAADRALAPIGESLPADVQPGNDAIAHVQSRLSAAYTKANGMIASVTPDDQFTQRLAEIKDGLKGEPPSVQAKFDAIVSDRVLSRLQAQPADGPAIQDITSQLGELANDNLSGGGADRTLGRHLNMVSDEVANLAGRQNPDYLTAKKAADTGWANFVRIRDAASRAGTDSGVFTPSQLKAAVRAQDSSVGKGAHARGDSLMFDLANNASGLMNSTIPNSGTADRAMLAGGVGLFAGVAPHVGLPVAAGLGLVSTPYWLMGRKIASAALDAGATRADLTAAAQRLTRLATKDPSVATLRDQVLQRLQAHGAVSASTKADRTPEPR